MKKFKKTYIEITNVCNLTCNFCPKNRRTAQFMSKEMFCHILEKIKGHSEHIYFHVMGEPLLHPDIGLFLDLCSVYGYRVNITTNGTLIKDVSDIIVHKPALRQVNFSLHSFEANTCKYSMDEYLDSIFQFIRKAREMGELLICLRIWNHPGMKDNHNYTNTDSTVSGSTGNNSNRYILDRIQAEFNYKELLEDKLTPCNGVKLTDYTFLNQAEVFDWPDAERSEIHDRAFCYGLRDQIAILVDGTVVPCCLDSEGTIKLGNIVEQDFDSIITGVRAKKIFDGFSKREAVEELCRKCGYRTRFNV